MGMLAPIHNVNAQSILKSKILLCVHLLALCVHLLALCEHPSIPHLPCHVCLAGVPGSFMQLECLQLLLLSLYLG